MPTAPKPKQCEAGFLGIRGYQGLEGTYDFARNGDGLHGYNIVRNNAGKIELMKRVDFPAQ